LEIIKLIIKLKFYFHNYLKFTYILSVFKAFILDSYISIESSGKLIDSFWLLDSLDIDWSGEISIWLFSFLDSSEIFWFSFD